VVDHLDERAIRGMFVAVLQEGIGASHMGQPDSKAFGAIETLTRQSQASIIPRTGHSEITLPVILGK
jgi:hypothetical protein